MAHGHFIVWAVLTSFAVLGASVPFLLQARDSQDSVDRSSESSTPA